MKLDISKFKKVSTHENHSVLKHPDGHEIKVLHKPLSPDVKKQLDTLPMAEGGAVEDKALKSNQRTEGFNEARSRGSKIVSKQLDKSARYAEGGNVKLEQAHKKDIHPEIKGDELAEMPDVRMMADGGTPATNQETANAFRSAFGSKPQPSPSQSNTSDASYNAIRQQNKSNMGYADGGPVTQDPVAIQSAQQSMRKAFHFEDGGTPAVSTESGDPAHAALSEAIKNLSSKYITQDNDQQNIPTVQTQQPVVDQSQPTPDQTPQPQSSLPQQAVQDVNAMNTAETQQAANTAQTLGNESDIQGQQAAKEQDLRAHYEQVGNQLHQQFQDTAQQVQEGKIDPQHWWNSKSTGSKILTAIGMLFAGAGGGVAGHPQAANNIINKFIDNDIESQKANLQNKNSLLSKYMEMYRSLPEAEQAARLTLSAGVEGLINQQATKLGSQNAMQAAQMANSQRRLSLLPQMEGLAKGQVMSNMYNQMGGAQSDNQPSSPEQSYNKQMQDMRILNPEIGKVMESKYLPNIGVASVAVPDAVREKLIAGKDLTDKLAKLELFARQHQGTVLDRAIVNQGRTLAADAQQAARVAGHQGVFKESDQKFLESMIDPDPTKFGAAIRTLPKYKQLRDSTNSSMNIMYKGYGVKPFNSTAENSQAAQWLKDNPNDPRAAAVRQKLGQ